MFATPAADREPLHDHHAKGIGSSKVVSSEFLLGGLGPLSVQSHASAFRQAIDRD